MVRLRSICLALGVCVGVLAANTQRAVDDSTGDADWNIMGALKGAGSAMKAAGIDASAITGGLNSIKGAIKGSANAGEKEACFTCELVVRRIVSMIGPPRATLTLDDWDIALQTACSTLPPMSYQAVSSRVRIGARRPCPAHSVTLAVRDIEGQKRGSREGLHTEGISR